MSEACQPTVVVESQTEIFCRSLFKTRTRCSNNQNEIVVMWFIRKFASPLNMVLWMLKITQWFKKKNWKMNERKPFKENDCTNIQKSTLLLSEAPEYQCDEGERISSENITTYSVPSLGKPKTTVFFVCFFFLFFCRRKDDKSFSRQTHWRK